jgi:hypothetical protein
MDPGSGETHVFVVSLGKVQLWVLKICKSSIMTRGK